MDTWVYQRIRATYRLRTIAWCLIAGAAVLFAASQHRYISNFLSGPFDFGQAELDAIEDVAAAPRYFVRVTGSKALDTGIQQLTTRKRAGAETTRSVSASFYALVVGERFLVVKRSHEGATTAVGELRAMPVELQQHLFATQQMQAIRGRFYPYYLDESAFRGPGYIGAAVALVLVVLLVKYGLPAWRYARDAATHPLVKRVASWGDPLGVAVEARRESESPRHRGGSWRVGDQYLIQSAPFAFDLLRLSDLLWGYKKVTKHSVNFIPTGKTYACILACYGGTAEVTGREKDVDALLAFAAERAPWAVFGYTDELSRTFKHKTAEFCAVVEERKREPARQAAR
jgi:hypothetical protein